jgi:hypothetical protein
MAYLQHFRVTVSGILGTTTTPVETWSTGFALIPETNADAIVSLPPIAEWNTAVSAFTTWFTGTTSRITQAATATEARCAWVGVNGRVNKGEDGAFLQYKTPLNAVGPVTISTSSHPFQIANVVSLRTPRADAGGRGRMYLPAPGLPVDIYGQISTADRDAVANGVAAMLTSFGNAFASLRPGVASQGSVLQGRGPSLAPVTSVRMGRVLDTVRSRRKNVAEAYVQAAVSDT